MNLSFAFGWHAAVGRLLTLFSSQTTRRFTLSFVSVVEAVSPSRRAFFYLIFGRVPAGAASIGPNVHSSCYLIFIPLSRPGSKHLCIRPLSSLGVCGDVAEARETDGSDISSRFHPSSVALVPSAAKGPKPGSERGRRSYFEETGPGRGARDSVSINLTSERPRMQSNVVLPSQ